MNFKKLENKSPLLLSLLIVFSVFVSLSCICAADVDGGEIISAEADGGEIISAEADGGEIISADADNGDIVGAEADGGEIISSDGGPILKDNDFTMTVRYNSGTGYCWKVSDETYGVEVNSIDNVLDHPGACGSSGTQYFNFHVTGQDYYVKLVLVSPSGKIVDEVDSNMLN